MTTDQALEKGRSGLVLTYNSADQLASRVVQDATARLKALELDIWEYSGDATIGDDKYPSMQATITNASSVAILCGPGGLGRLQGSVEIGWALDAKANGARVAAVFLPGVERSEVPAELSGIQAQQWLGDDDVADMSLTDRGLAQLCGVAVEGLNTDQALEWLLRRRRDLGLLPPKRAKALLIGIAEYADGELDNLNGPEPDLDGLQGTLGSLEISPGTAWDVTSKLNLNGVELQRELREFFLGQDVDGDDLLLFYFSGHGMPSEEGKPLLMPSNASARVPSENGVAAETIRAYLRESRALATFVILDCCHGEGVEIEPEKEAGGFADLPDRSAVLGASRGLTSDSNRPGERSPFTNALIQILETHPSSTMRDLEQLLASEMSSVWCKSAGVKTVTMGESGHVQPTEGRQLLGRIGFGQSSSEREQLDDLRRLVQTLEALLAVAPRSTQALNEVVRNSLDLVMKRLRSLTRSPTNDPFDWNDVGTSQPNSFVEVAFGEQDVNELADLPWEYLGIPADRLLEWFGLAQIRRVIPVPAGSKSPITDKVRSPLVLGGLRPDADRLKDLTKSETERIHEGAFVDEGQWGQLMGRTPDLLAIQCELLPSGEMFVHPATSDEPWRLDYLQAAVKQKPIHTLVIETIADQRNPLAAGALRQLAVKLTQLTSRSVIAVCHQSAYLARLDDSGTPMASSGGSGGARSFVGTVLQHLSAGGKLEDAAAKGRANVLSAMGPGNDQVVGIPVTVRPESPQVTNAPPANSPVRTRRQPQERSSDQARPQADAAEMSSYDVS